MLNRKYYYSELSIFEDRIKAVLNKITPRSSILSLNFFGETNPENYLIELTLIRSLVEEFFNNQTPIISYIPQAIEQKNSLAVEVSFLETDKPISSIFLKRHEDIQYYSWMIGQERIIMLEGVVGKSFQDSIGVQSECIFNKIDAIFKIEDFYIPNIIRQWNYIGNITETEHDIQNYQAFNNARAEFYNRWDWTVGYPAATGIGMSLSGVIVSLIAVSNASTKYIYPINNPLQIPAFAYSDNLLIGNSTINRPKLSPKFERAKAIRIGNQFICFVSGTAAIRGEQSMKELDAAKQTQQTIENIDFLISQENIKNQHQIEIHKLEIKSIRVYIKHQIDFESVKNEVEKTWKNIPAIYLNADICRQELLVEIEAIAMVEM